MEEIDVRGLACPQPVLRTKAALERLEPGESVRMRTDSPVSRDNIVRFATKSGFAPRVHAGEGEEFLIHIEKPEEAISCEAIAGKATTIFVSSDTIGQGDDTLGAILMKAFLRALPDIDPKPKTLCRMNAGVRLAVEGSEHLESLKLLADRGIEILVCGTCLDYFGLKEKAAVGQISNMFSIAEALLSADNTVRI